MSLIDLSNFSQIKFYNFGMILMTIIITYRYNSGVKNSGLVFSGGEASGRHSPGDGNSVCTGQKC